MHLFQHILPLNFQFLHLYLQHLILVEQSFVTLLTNFSHLIRISQRIDQKHILLSKFLYLLNQLLPLFVITIPHFLHLKLTIVQHHLDFMNLLSKQIVLVNKFVLSRQTCPLHRNHKLSIIVKNIHNQHQLVLL